MVLATAAIAGIHWYRTLPRSKAETYGAARFDRIQDAKPDARTQPRRAQPTQLEQVPEPPVEASDLIEKESGAAIEPSAAVEPPPEPAPRRRASPKLEPKPTASEAAPPAPADASVLAEESRLLARARRSLRDDDFEAALEWAEEHARRHPQGSLSEERLILEAVAACRGDQRARGLAAAKQLRERFPRTAALAKVDQACAE